MALLIDGGKVAASKPKSARASRRAERRKLASGFEVARDVLLGQVAELHRLMRMADALGERHTADEAFDLAERLEALAGEALYVPDTRD